MGCDIHCHAEVRGPATRTWHKVGAVFPNPYTPGELTDDPIYLRDYDIFAVLADVRNGRGFGGIPTGLGFNPISGPRGLPPDVSPEVAADSESWDSDGHSHSHLTLRELQDFDWSQTTRHDGIVTPDEYAHFAKHGKPDSWCGGVFGGGTKTVSNAEMQSAIGSSSPDLPNLYTRVSWTETYAVSCKHLLEETIPNLARLGPPDDVRIVFWFDN